LRITIYKIRNKYEHVQKPHLLEASQITPILLQFQFCPVTPFQVTLALELPKSRQKHNQSNGKKKGVHKTEKII
jgi:hypothetical protein